MLRLLSKRARSSERHQLRGFGYFKRTGPGFVTGAADDDPAGIGTYSHVGARFRFDLVWMAPLCLPLASAVIAFAVGICALEFFVSYDRYSLVLRWLALSIFAYVLELAFIEVDWS
ncbi:MAG TPA: hypothetical protein VFZ50_02040, partial [Actinomycetota bacterium]|nr:hypothetical protein [Actinomycetota bacterium]